MKSTFKKVKEDGLEKFKWNNLSSQKTLGELKAKHIQASSRPFDMHLVYEDVTSKNNKKLFHYEWVF